MPGLLLIKNMKFTLNITTDCNNVAIKDECMEAVAEILKSRGKYFDVGYNPNEMNVNAKC